MLLGLLRGSSNRRCVPPFWYPLTLRIGSVDLGQSTSSEQPLLKEKRITTKRLCIFLPASPESRYTLKGYTSRGTPQMIARRIPVIRQLTPVHESITKRSNLRDPRNSFASPRHPCEIPKSTIRGRLAASRSDPKIPVPGTSAQFGKATGRTKEERLSGPRKTKGTGGENGIHRGIPEFQAASSASRDTASPPVHARTRRTRPE